MPKKYCFLLVLVVLFFAPRHVYAQVIINFTLGGKDVERDIYRTELVKMILDNTRIDYKILYFKENGDHQAQINWVKNGRITISTFGSSAQQEKVLIPIRIPIFKGLIGYRIFLIKKNDQDKFNNIRSLHDLRQLKGAQGIGWTDLTILQDAGLPQEILPGNIIYRILNRGGRVDYFPRAVYEAVGEIQTMQLKHPDIAIEKKILLVYPFAMYFYVSPRYSALAKAFDKSFQELVADGSFDRFFYQHPYIKTALKTARLQHRVRFDLTNKTLSSKTATLPAVYWVDLKKINLNQ